MKEYRVRKIREMIDGENNRYIINKKNNNHVELVKFEQNSNKGIVLGTRKLQIFKILEEIYKQKGLKNII